jgi:hypothetical protein
MSIGTDGELFSAAMGGEDLTKFDTMDAGAPDIFSDEGVSEAEGLLEKVAESAAPKVDEPAAPAVKDDGPPAWFRAWEASQKKPEPAPVAKVEEKPAPTPEEALAALVNDPNKAIADQARRIAEEMFAPMQVQYREAIVRASKASAITDHGKEALTAAEAALEAAVKAGQIDEAKAMAALKASTDPYGDIVRWHTESQQRARMEAMSRDPDGFLMQQLAEAAKDPAKREKFLAAFGQAEPSPPASANAGGNVTEMKRDANSGKFLPSVNRASSAKDDDEEPSDPGVVFSTAMRGARR